MTFHRSVRRRAVGAPGLARFTPIRHTTALRTERTCGVVGSGRGSPGAGVESPARLGRHRWRVERALSWLSCFRRLQVRWDPGLGWFFPFVLVACALVCFNRL